MTTTITCIKSEFRANLRNHYATGVVIDKAQADELDEVIDGLVRQANEHRGTFEGYSAYLDCDFTVTPDETKCADCDAPGVRMDHGDGGPGSDFSVKLRCERHSRPDSPTAQDDEDGCEGHESLNGADMGQTVFCDGTCRPNDKIAIPAVTDAQRKDSFLAASMTVGQVSLELDMVGARGLTPERLEALADLLGVAAGHLRIANGQG
jgi:hypothetical protein